MIASVDPGAERATQESAMARPVDELERRIGQLERILDVACVLNATLDQEIQLGVIQDLATELTGTEVSSIFLLDGSTGELYAEVATGRAAERLKRVVVPLAVDETIGVGLTVLLGVVVSVKEVETVREIVEVVVRVEESVRVSVTLSVQLSVAVGVSVTEAVALSVCVRVPELVRVKVSVGKGVSVGVCVSVSVRV